MPTGIPRSSARRQGTLGVLGPLVFTLAWIAGALLQSDYSVRREDVSGLTAETADAPWATITGIVVMGACTVLLGVGLLRALGGPLRRCAGPLLIIASGVATICVGVFRNDCSTALPACQALIEAGDISWRHIAHDLATWVVFTAFIAAPLPTGWRMRSELYWRPLALPSMLLTPLLGVLLVLYGIEPVAGWGGALQRALLTPGLVWLAVLGLRLAVLPESH